MAAVAPTWTEMAEEFVAVHGLGARGKHAALSRMFNPTTDMPTLHSSKLVCAYRPRGILSGFLVIHPQLQHAVYLPPPSAVAGKPQSPMRFWMRLAPSVLEHGMVASAYLYNKQVVVEDLVYMDGVSVWHTRPFPDRWARLRRWLEQEVRQDVRLQGGISLSCTSYMSPGALVEPPEDKVVEFVPCDAVGGGRQRRILWIPERGAGTGAGAGAGAVVTAGDATHMVKREAVMGPDVYSVHDGDKKLGIALVRTLTVSRALRLAFAAAGSDCETLRVQTKYNKQFDKWEIMGV
jgi:hypothetical protein